VVEVRPSSISATSVAATDPAELANDAAAGTDPNQSTSAGDVANIDPLARFGALNGLHMLAQRADSGAKNPLGSQDGPPIKTGPVLYSKQDEVPGGKVTKAAPAQTYDVSTVKQSQIDALKAYPNGMTQADVDKLTRRNVSRGYIEALQASKDPKQRAEGARLASERQQGDAIEAQRRLGITIEKAKIAYADLLNQKPPAKIYVTTSAGNGGQPVLVIVGPGFDRTKPAKHIHTHYHGDNATVADPAGSKAGTNARIADQLKREPQSVWVLPESTARPKDKVEWPQQPDTPTHNGKYFANWDHVQSQVQTTADALKAAGVDGTNAKQVVSFHSRGGEALMNIMRDKSGAGLKADRLELHDCLYGSQFSAAAWGATANGKAASRVVVYRGWLGSDRGDVVAAAFKTPRGATVKRFEQIDVNKRHLEAMKKDPKHEDAVNPVYTDGTKTKYSRESVQVPNGRGGEKWVPIPLRQFDPDRHYRTTGQYLDTEPGP
jgi:hypothetical protein